MADTDNKKSLSVSLNAALEKSRGLVVAISVVVFVLILAVVIVATVVSKSTERGIEKIDTITFTLLNEADSISEEDVSVRISSALDSLSELTGKGGIVGARANMLSAELVFIQKKYDSARDFWLKAASAGKKSYIAPLSYYKAAVCCEELGDFDNAVLYYRAAASDKDFVLLDHALFSLGRACEQKQDFAAAEEAYERLNSRSPTSSWGLLAKTRLISMKADGFVQ